MTKPAIVNKASTIWLQLALK